MRIAIVHDWLDTWRGGEHVAGRAAADLSRRPTSSRWWTSFRRLRTVRSLERADRRPSCSGCPEPAGISGAFLPLFPRAIESLDVCGLRPRGLQLARRREGRAHPPPISSTSAIATRRCATRGTCATSTCGRWRPDAARPWARARRHLLDRLRDWDRAHERRVDALRRHFAVHSRTASAAAMTATRRSSRPPVDAAVFTPGERAAA